jgi:tRNA1(Val) A37 N6-methylase TrmN6
MNLFSEQYSELTLTLTKQLSKTEKKEYGIFITPRSIIKQLYQSIMTIDPTNIPHFKNILEPSCGTCEMLNYFSENLNNVDFDCIEYNETIFDAIKNMSCNNVTNTVSFYKMDFMNYISDKLYDLIIGNPPYFVCKKEKVPIELNEFISGRPNIFGLFILKSIMLLKPNGILAFIIPRSFLNSVYYSKIRDFIKKTCRIIIIQDYNDDNVFIDTVQMTIGLVIQRLEYGCHEQEDCPYSLKLNNSFIFSDNSLQLKQLFEGSTTIEKMGLKVRTGQIVWNEHKDILSDNEDHSLLVYNTNISKNNTLEVKKFKNDQKGQYIDRDGRIDPVLVVNRGNGNSKYKLNYAVITLGPYLVENHLNEIYSPKKINKEELLELYKKITASFQNLKTQQFIDLFLGNNGLSKTELETIFPIYI